MRSIVIGKLCWSDEIEYYIETDDGGLWAVDFPELMADPVDRMTGKHVMIEGGLAGVATIAVSAIVEMGRMERQPSPQSCH